MDGLSSTLGDDLPLLRDRRNAFDLDSYSIVLPPSSTPIVRASTMQINSGSRLCGQYRWIRVTSAVAANLNYGNDPRDYEIVVGRCARDISRLGFVFSSERCALPAREGNRLGELRRSSVSFNLPPGTCGASLRYRIELCRCLT